LATPSDAHEVAAIAVADARIRLVERGIDPDEHLELLGALEHGIGQVIAARELGRDVREYRSYVEAVYERLDASLVVDELPRPPRRRLRSPT
jgi:hypothetical protein